MRELSKLNWKCFQKHTYEMNERKKYQQHTENTCRYVQVYTDTYIKTRLLFLRFSAFCCCFCSFVRLLWHTSVCCALAGWHLANLFVCERCVCVCSCVCVFVIHSSLAANLYACTASKAIHRQLAYAYTSTIESYIAKHTLVSYYHLFVFVVALSLPRSLFYTFYTRLQRV